MTNSSDKQSVPDKTDKADIISNDEFLNVVYGELPDDVRGMIVSSKGNPKLKPKGFWNAKTFGEDIVMPDDHNNFFTLSSFTPNEKGEHRRQKKLFSAMHAIMLDDIGTKVPVDQLPLEPTWIIETSPGNYHYGYIFNKPITDQKLADNLMKAIIEAGWSDPGADGPCARLARLPNGVNGKHDPVFNCCLKSWKPDLRYNVDELVKGFSLGFEKNEKAKKAPRPHQIYTPSPDENPVIAALKSKGLYKREIEEGKHDITCPWVEEHTDSIDDGAAYFGPSEISFIGGFKCHHGHCKDRTIYDLLEFLEIPVSSAGMKPVITIISGELYNMVDYAEQELAKIGQYYQYGDLIVTIVEDKTTQEVVIKDMKPSALDAVLARYIIWEAYDGRYKCVVRKDVPRRVVSAMMEAPEYKHLPFLSGLAHQPYIHDKNVINKSGYNAVTGMFGIFDEKEFDVPDKPSRKDAEAALDILYELLNEFPFAEEHDKAAALSAILTATIRGSLDLSPMYHVRAPEISSGKSFLCSIVSSFATSAVAAAAPFPQNDEECRKHLLSLFLKGKTVVIFDNLTSDIAPHNSFCAILTSPYHSDRILGVSKTTTVSTRTLFLSNGNNVGPIQDMTRRCCVINLDPACEMPATREFKKPNLLSDLRNNRAKYVSAALTIIQAWINDGCPKTECKSIASYTEWSDLCRQPLMWLGLPDPATNMFNTMNDDPERDLLGHVLRTWYDMYESAPMKTSAFVRDTMLADNDFNTDDINDVLTDIAGDKNGINNTRLGRWIKRNMGKIVDGLRFSRVSSNTNTALWKVEKVK